MVEQYEVYSKIKIGERKFDDDKFTECCVEKCSRLATVFCDLGLFRRYYTFQLCNEHLQRLIKQSENGEKVDKTFKGKGDKTEVSVLVEEPRAIECSIYYQKCIAHRCPATATLTHKVELFNETYVMDVCNGHWDLIDVYWEIAKEQN